MLAARSVNLKSCVVFSLVTRLTYFHSSTSLCTTGSAFALYLNLIDLALTKKPYRPSKLICFVMHRGLPAGQVFLDLPMIESGDKL